uniref:DUF7027 domain-containing protein n=1 Tax=Plectus sambesii TaxID=2011161 RepID=A0A914VG43_9BILA
MSQVRPTFDPNDPKYICCCGCHVMTGAKILAFIFTVAAILNTLYVIILVYIATQSKFDDGYFYYQIGGFFVFIVVLGCLWYGLIKEREGWLLPMLIYM